jgi:uracil phosphoribosyltransferase
VPHLTVLDHPLIRHKLTLMRRRETSTGEFRRLAREVGLLLAYDATRDLPLATLPIETPLEAMAGEIIAGKAPCFVSILRAGNGLLDGMLDLIPSAAVGHIGIFRDHATLAAVEYYVKLPDDLAERLVIIVDPMLATGNSAIAAAARLRQAGAVRLRFACLVAAPEGVAAMARAHPEIPIFTCGLDRGLDAHAYIRPGLGDAGDRLFGTT